MGAGREGYGLQTGITRGRVEEGMGNVEDPEYIR